MVGYVQFVETLGSSKLPRWRGQQKRYLTILSVLSNLIAIIPTRILKVIYGGQNFPGAEFLRSVLRLKKRKKNS